MQRTGCTNASARGPAAAAASGGFVWRGERRGEGPIGEGARRGCTSASCGCASGGARQPSSACRKRMSLRTCVLEHVSQAQLRQMRRLIRPDYFQPPAVPAVSAGGARCAAVRGGINQWNARKNTVAHDRMRTSVTLPPLACLSRRPVACVSLLPRAEEPAFLADESKPDYKKADYRIGSRINYK